MTKLTLVPWTQISPTERTEGLFKLAVKKCVTMVTLLNTFQDTLLSRTFVLCYCNAQSRHTQELYSGSHLQSETNILALTAYFRHIFSWHVTVYLIQRNVFRAFPCCTLAEEVSTWVTILKLLTQVTMVDNLAEKVDECPLNWGRYILLVYKWDPEKRGVRYSGVAKVLKWMEGQPGLPKLPFILWVSAVTGFHCICAH